MRKILLTTIIALFSMAGAMAQENYDFSAVSGGNTLYYKITDAESTPKTVAVVSELINYPYYYYIKPTGTLTIPETVSNGGTTYSVTSIGDWAFAYCDGITGSLTIPNSVDSIGKDAFSHC